MKLTTKSTLLEEWLTRRIGHGQIICATGKLESAYKYITLPSDYQPDIAAYLSGDLNHIYGSRPSLPDGTTYLIGFDFDDTQPELDAAHKEHMTKLSDAGIPCAYWKRRVRRGHLEVYSDAPVDIEAFYGLVIAACPSLADVPECFPIGDRENNALSWPFWYRVGDKVYESGAEFCFPNEPFYFSSGITSDQENIIALIERCTIPASLIPPITPPIIEQIPTYQGGVIGLHKQADDDVLQAALAWWESQSGHDWEDITKVKNNRFLASWRGENTPSVVIDPDRLYACDYGRIGENGHKKIDRFQAWCLINNLDAREEINKLCTAFRKEYRGMDDEENYLDYTIDAHGKRVIQTYSGDDILALPDPEYLIANILQTATVSLWFGESGTGKTFLALLTAWCIAEGTEWLGRRVQQGSVLYIYAEGIQGMKPRLQALMKETGRPIPQGLALLNGPFILSMKAKNYTTLLKRTLGKITPPPSLLLTPSAIALQARIRISRKKFFPFLI